MINFPVHNRFTGDVQFTAKIDCSEDVPLSIKLGLAVRYAIANNIDLSDANLVGADLWGANLKGVNLGGVNLGDANLERADLERTNLRWAYLRGANLVGTYLRGANLRGAMFDEEPFKACLWRTLCANPNEIEGLILAIKEGRVDGSKYHGECACLIGTIANLRGVDPDTLYTDPSDPSERWFLMIKKGDKPGDDTGGGFAAQKALEWIQDWQANQGLAS